MTNPPDFVMYVVMAKLPHDAVFNPVWNRERGKAALGFKGKKDALAVSAEFNARYGTGTAYLGRKNLKRRKHERSGCLGNDENSVLRVVLSDAIAVRA